MSEFRFYLRRLFTLLRTEGASVTFRRGMRHLRATAERSLRSLVRRDPRTRRVYERLFDSTEYWESRYESGAWSGPGSYGEHAQFKADVINEFVRDHDVDTVVEFGCGDGNQIALGEYPRYVGMDVADAAVDRCRERFTADETKRFEYYDPATFDRHDDLDADLVLALEVVFHLVEDEVFEQTMRDIFETSDRYVILFSSNYEDPAPTEKHMRHRRFTDYVEREFPAFELVDFVKNPFEDRLSDFYVYERTDARGTR